MVVLLARLHLIGFLWGDVSLSNTLFRRDAGAFAAYLVDAETGELHEQLTNGQREHDLTIARTNLFGEFCDLEAGGLLDEALDPLVLVETIENRYRELWSELTGVEEFDGSEMHRIESPRPPAERPRLRRRRAGHHHRLRRLDHPDPAQGRRRRAPLSAGCSGSPGWTPRRTRRAGC